ncbi:MAG: HlyD family type I secretion periplasmic adaptor subunit [Alphaproteobacteria bacterium]|nr:MAG: HlyD family type I secretion periplasmic adaptor subunit [Alphaproteobacteria bacterium]
MDKEDVEFMSELEAAAHLKPARAAQLFLWVVAALFGWAVLWAAVSEVDERVRGTGQVMPSSDIQVVQSLEGGVLGEILVNEGDHVKKDQILLRIKDVQFASEGRGIEAQKLGWQAKRARLKAEASGQPYVADPAIAGKYPDIAANEEKLYKSRQAELKTSFGIIEDEVREAQANLSEVRSNIAKFAKSRDLLNKQLDITRRLVEQKAQPEIEQLKLEQQLNEISGNLSSAYQSEQSLQARLSAAKKKEEEKTGAFRSQALGELNDVEAKIASIQESLASVQDKVSRAELRSPVDGTVHKLHVKTVGGVISPAQKLVEIVPGTDDLMIRAKILPADVAFLKPGQDVRVSITAYDPQIYGTLKGRLERISADTVEDSKGEAYFEIDVRTDRNYLGEADHPLRIAPGMVSETEVIVGKRTILTYLMKPVLRTKDRAFTEK